MKAVTFDLHTPRIAASKFLSRFSQRAHVAGWSAVRCQHVPDAQLLGNDWVIIEPSLAGVCGSDLMQVFIKSGYDNPLSAVVSAPHIMGHEVVGAVIETGSAVRRFRIGDRVAVSPWLSCTPRGLPACESCADGHYPLCSNFFEGNLARGMHAGNCRDVGGGFAEAMSLHESMLFPIPESVPFETAVLADPFAVALHCVLRAPPEPGQTVVVYGCGSIGLLTIHILSVLFPRTTILAIDQDARLEAQVEKLGAHSLFTTRGRDLVAEVGERMKAKIRQPMFGLPWLQTGVDRVYDTVGSAGTIEIGLRISRPRASIVMVGVAPPKRVEWTPLYFKEISLLGSNAYGLETFEGKRTNAIEIYLDLLAQERLQLGQLVTHRYPLERYADAFLASHQKATSGAIKVVFEPKLSASGAIP